MRSSAYYKASAWPYQPVGETSLVAGSTGIVDTVRTTLYSIGHVGYENALEASSLQAAVENFRGEFTIGSATFVDNAISDLDLTDANTATTINVDSANAYPLAV